MDRLAAGVLIVIATLVFNSGYANKAQAAEIRPQTQVVQVLTVRPQPVVSLLICLEMLRSAPTLIDPPKV